MATAPGRYGGVLDIPRETIRRLASTNGHLAGAPRINVALRDYARASASAGSIAADVLGDVDRAVAGMDAFIEALFGMPQVEAMALLSSHAPNCAATLTVVILVPMRRGDQQSAQAVRAVGRSYAALADQLSPHVPSGLQFVSTAHADAATLEHHLRIRWDQDPAVRPLAFVVFERD